ncbi:MAG: pilus assembly protein TadG-related protein [Pseudolabrys sp.]
MKNKPAFSLARALLQHFGRDSRGSIAITFALLTIPCLLAVGAAVDYSQANRVKATLDSYADTSVWPPSTSAPCRRTSTTPRATR